MPKRNRNIDKNMNIKQAKNSNLDSSSDKEEHPARKRKKQIHDTEGIAMSKQLQMKLKKIQSDILTKRNKKNTNRVCGNGKPLPSLRDLELLFQDSDEDAGENHTEANISEQEVTPETVTGSDPDKYCSPITRTRITEQAKKILANNATLNGNRTEIPVKKELPTFNGNAYELCDLTLSSDEGQETENEKHNNNQATNHNQPDMFDYEPYNKSQDLLVEHINDRRISSDSDNISECALPKWQSSTSYTNSVSETFEPLPSTSRDDLTFVKNDELFNMSLKKIAKSKAVPIDKEDEDLQVIETPVETITIENGPGKDAENPKKTLNNSFKTLKIPEKSILNNCDKVIEVDSNNTNLPVSNQRNNLSNTDPEKCNILTVNMSNDTIEINFDIPYESNNSNNMIDTNSEIPGASTLNISNDGVDIGSGMHNPSTLNNSNNVMSSSNTIYIEDDDDVSLISERKFSEHHSPIEVDNHIPGIHNNTDDTGNETLDIDALIAQNQTILNKYESKRSSSLNSVIDASGIPVIPESHSRNNPYSSNGIFNIQKKRKCKCKPPHAMLWRLGGNYFEPLEPRYNCSNAVRRPNSQTQQNSILIMDNISDHIPQPSLTPNAPIVLDSEEQQQPLNGDQISNGLTNCVKSLNSGKDNTKQKNIGECPICMEPLMGSLGSTLCGHVFCMSCLKTAFRQSKKCPTCRKTLKKNDFHPIFL